MNEFLAYYHDFFLPISISLFLGVLIGSITAGMYFYGQGYAEAVRHMEEAKKKGRGCKKC